MAQTMTEDEAKEYERQEVEVEIHQKIDECESHIAFLVAQLEAMEWTSYTIPSFKGVNWHGE